MTEEEETEEKKAKGVRDTVKEIWEEKRPKHEAKVLTDAKKGWKTLATSPDQSPAVFSFIRKNHPVIFWVSLIVGVILYSAAIYLAIIHFILPPVVAIYSFTTQESEQIGIILEADIVSASIIGIIAYIFGRRAGRRQADLATLRLMLKEDREETVKAMVKALKEDGEKEG